MKAERFEMRATADFLAKLDEWRRRQSDLPSRAEAIRRIVDRSLEGGDGPHLRDMLATYLGTDRDRLVAWGGQPGEDADAVAGSILTDKHTGLARPAASLLDTLDDDPRAAEIVALLRRLVL